MKKHYNEKSLYPYIDSSLKDHEGPSEPGNTTALPHYIVWGLERSLVPFSQMRMISLPPENKFYFGHYLKSNKGAYEDEDHKR